MKQLVFDLGVGIGVLMFILFQIWLWWACREEKKS